MSEEAPEIQINVKGPSELKLQIAITTDKTVLELKQAIAAKSDVEADRQRLIYSGRVLKDDDALSVYKIQSGHTIHMVKGVSRSTGGASGSSGSSTTPQQLPTMQTGQNVHDPLTQLNGHMGFGAMAGLNPFGEMGLNPNDPNMMQTMLNSPQFLQQMSAMMSNPAVVDQIIASNPQLASMGPQVRQAFQDEQFRNMISNPESLQSMLRMASMLRGAGLGPAAPFGAAPPTFPAPGNPTSPSQNAGTTDPATAGSQQPPINPFNMFGAPAPGSPGAAGAAGANPFGNQAGMLEQMLGLPGLGGFGGFGAMPPPPADTRPPEERFQVQLQAS
ncbi:hypothetical protein D9613_012200 [Agrocybe pediades]|uniref:Ubiquitin-like domain-containing protein n=1 Tax=Agrocybe pediades TaxID=84607 RepID=A0A8H4VTP9_9AGAR|nr:hypothetical protein D9613_012200 [Agrocybe pediades]